MEKIHQIPFLRLILPLLIGIIVQYHFFIHKWSIIPLLLGCGMMLLSYFIPPKLQFRFRWIFGIGVVSFIFTIGVVSTLLRQQISSFTFPDISESYQAVVIDIPQEKANTYAYKVELKEQNKKIVCYLPKSSSYLKTGDSFSFFSKIEPFNSSGNPDEFDYALYMYNKGYAGQSFVYSDRWERTDIRSNNLFVNAAKSRQYILDFYKSFGLNADEYAILSALTLGYQDALSDDLAQSFRTTGTAHLLAVSGMHVGIIYFVILFLLSFIPKHSRYRWLRQILTISLLWLYVFIIGFPPSAVRACIMLSVFCIAQAKGVKSYSFNTLFATAFLMLVWKPFWLFDLGFQLSFVAVLSMLILTPIFYKCLPLKTDNRYAKYFLNIFVISLAAQIGTFPLCLYYFGTFPTYFFLTNLFIIPLVCLVMYLALPLVFISAIGDFFPHIANYPLAIVSSVYRALVLITTRVIQFFENLPFAQLQDLNISFPGLFLLWGIIIFSIHFLVQRKPKVLICSLSCVFIFMMIPIGERINNRNSLSVYNRRQCPQIKYYLGYSRFDLTDISENKMLWLDGQKYLILTQDIWKEQSSENRFHIDYLHIIGNNQMSLYSLNQKFNIKKIILDGSLSANNLKRFVLECEKLRIPYYKVSENGRLRIFF